MPEHDRSATGAGVEPAAKVLLDQAFDRTGLVALRNAVAAHADRLDLPGDAVERLVLAAYELASNAVRHGGGRGRLSMSTGGGLLRCTVRDEGPGFPGADQAGRVRPEPTAPGGRGLWLVRCVADDLAIRSGPGGTVAVAAFTLG